MRNESKLYLSDDICELLEKAEKLGYSLERGSELERMTIAQLEEIVNRPIV